MLLNKNSITIPDWRRNTFNVVKHNNLVKANVDVMSINQIKIMNLIISQMDSFKTLDSLSIDDFIFDLKLDDIKKLMNIDSLKKRDMEYEIDDLSKKRVIFNDPDRKSRNATFVPIFQVIDYSRNINGHLTGIVNGELAPYFFELQSQKSIKDKKGNFTKFLLKDILSLNSKYSILLFELMEMDNWKQGKVYYPVSELKDKLQIDSDSMAYSNFKYFNQILKRAKLDIEKNTQIRFQMEYTKLGKSVVEVGFLINKTL